MRPATTAVTAPPSLEKRYAMLGAVLIAPTVLVFCAVILYPLVSAIYLSLFSIYTPTLAGEWVGVDNYTELLAGGRFWNAVLNTLIWTVGTLTLQIVFGVAVALLLNQSIVFRSLAPQSDPLPLLSVHGRGGARLALALQRPLRDPEPSCC